MIVDTMDRCAADSELARILERHLLEIGRRDRRRLLAQLGVPHAATARPMMYRTGACLAVRFRHAPRLGSGRYEHCARRGTDTAHRQPIGRRGRTAAGPLILEFVRVERCLLDTYVLPVDIQF